jgi:probable DNA metabolism protein
MGDYRYDGSFEGFLCAVACCLELGERNPGFTWQRPGDETGLFASVCCEVMTVRETALAFRRRFVATASQEAFARARYAFHSRVGGIEGLLWRYLLLGLEQGRQMERLLTAEPVCPVNRIARRVSHEAHKFKGFVRFRELREGILYAQIEPEADILSLIAPHFVGRVADRPWMIHDLRRRQAALFDLRSWRLVDGVELTGEPGFTAAEHEHTALWQGYFRHHAIKERHNPGLQQKHVPLKYRRHLLEFPQDTEDNHDACHAAVAPEGKAVPGGDAGSRSCTR